jgi:uncharacterized membrane protein
VRRDDNPLEFAGFAAPGCRFEDPLTVTFAPSPWPAPPSRRGAAAPRLGRDIEGAVPRAVQWVLRRNCSITPRQLLGFYLSLASVSLLIGFGFWRAGAPAVLVFAGIELVMVGLALAVYARHAADCAAVDATRFRAEFVRIEPSAGEGSLVEVSGEGQRAQVGRYLRPEWRTQLAQEIRAALHLRA